MRNTWNRESARPRRRSAAVALAGLLAAAAALTGCTTAQMPAPPAVDALASVPVGTRVRVVTREGETLRLKVTAATSEALTGRDRYFRSHELRREDIAEIDAPPRNDTWVAVFLFALFFLARS